LTAVLRQSLIVVIVTDHSLQQRTISTRRFIWPRCSGYWNCFRHRKRLQQQHLSPGWNRKMRSPSREGNSFRWLIHVHPLVLPFPILCLFLPVSCLCERAWYAYLFVCNVCIFVL